MYLEFLTDVIEGLTASPKYLKSKYFYDEHGDELFKSIMQLEEYYLTRCEFEIFTSQKEKILSIFSDNGNRFQLIEFGAGDGTKTKKLLEYFHHKKVDFKYIPIDISDNILNELTSELKSSLPGLEVEGINNDYFKVLKQLNSSDATPKVILFLGSNIGNFTEMRALEFLSSLRSYMKAHDKVMIGFDLIKDPEVIYRAYNDRSGITRAFNLNLLERINRELDADFSIPKFYHFPLYDPVAGQARSYLISKEKQTVHIKKADLTIEFRMNEPIHMEISQKFDLEQINSLASDSGFSVMDNLFDCRYYFVDSIWQANS
jgi:L-histidine Nalpha-methyltransferase